MNLMVLLTCKHPATEDDHSVDDYPCAEPRSCRLVGAKSTMRRLALIAAVIMDLLFPPER